LKGSLKKLIYNYFVLSKGMTEEINVDKSLQVPNMQSNVIIDVEETINKDEAKTSFFRCLMPCFFK
jgi:hypothetical protein